MLIRMDLALNNLQWLICHTAKPNQTNFIYEAASPKSSQGSRANHVIFMRLPTKSWNHIVEGWEARVKQYLCVTITEKLLDPLGV